MSEGDSDTEGTVLDENQQLGTEAAGNGAGISGPMTADGNGAGISGPMTADGNGAGISGP